MKKAEPTIHEYWPQYWRRTLFLIIGMQCIAILIVSIALIYVEIVDPAQPAFWIQLVGILAAVTAVNILVATIVTEPLKQLIAALAQVAGERTTLVPPNPNAKRYEKNGLKPVLQSIYEAPLKTTLLETQETSLTHQPGIEQALTATNVGVAFFDEAGNLLYSNDNIPFKKVNEKPVLALEFYTDTSFDAWLAESKQKSVRAEKIWTRVASKPLGQEGRKIFDVVANYQRGEPIAVSLVLIEKTDEYSAEDDDLNFIAFAAHELRGPITVIRGYLDTLNDELQPTLDDEQRELFKRLIVSANRLDTYIKNILNSSRYDRRHFSVRLSEVRLLDIYSAVADDMQLRASAQHRLLSVDIPADLPSVAADVSSISEVLANLIDNAVKYSNEGGSIEVRAEQDGAFVKVDIVDHGIGMPPNVIGNLFHKFYRSHRSRETVSGSGIGLYISKAIVESHGGTMHVRSVEGEGSTFSFTLPLYSSVADKLSSNANNNQALITKTHEGSWIKNHGVIRG
jgi:signal transduction histidine kinase